MSKVTKTGSALGTPAYMPPEQLTGSKPEPAADQYAFAVMLFEMLTGRRPFETDDPMSTALKHLTELPPSPRIYKARTSFVKQRVRGPVFCFATWTKRSGRFWLWQWDSLSLCQESLKA